MKETSQNKDYKNRSVFIPRIEVVNEERELIKISDPSRVYLIKERLKLGKRFKFTLITLGIFFLLFFAFNLFLAYRLYKEALLAKTYVHNLANVVNSQDLNGVKQELQNIKFTLKEIKDIYRNFLWARYLPFFGPYIYDGEHVLNAAGYGIEAGEQIIEVVEPYADIIGFKTETKQAQSGEESAKDRLDFIIKSLPELISKSDSVSEEVLLLRKEVDQVNPYRYPETLFGLSIRERLIKGIALVDEISRFAEKGKPLVENLPFILGTESERKYLIIFQNDKELRPTGGFITAYSIAKMSKGRFEPVSSNDIYNLDSQYQPKIKAPSEIVKYLKGPYLISKYLRLRDINWWPDFAYSMSLFTNEVKTVGIKDIDGVISVDTQALVNILDVIGPVSVPGFGEFSTKKVDQCDCPQVIYELESFADIEGPIVWSQDEPGKIIYAPPNYDNRKKIIGPLMNSILANTLGQPKDKLSALFEAGIKSLFEKHILFYMLDDSSQLAVKEFGIGGTIDEYEGDYLHINDANLGGRKSNLYVTQEVEQEIEFLKDGSVKKSVTITYKNSADYDGWLNSVLPNWVRIYTPKGSELIEFEGVKEKVDPYEELGKTVFAGYFELRPKGIAKVRVTYTLPFKFTKEYKLLIQKQPGKDAPLYTFHLGKHSEEFFLKEDKEIILEI